MIGLSNDEVFDKLLERLECSIVDCSRIVSEPFRLDAEYYSKRNILLEELIKSTKGRTIGELDGIADCSAFYPSITGYYSNDKTLIPFIRVNEIQKGLVVLTDDTVFLPEKVLSDNPTTISVAYPGDIVIAKGGNTLAKVGLVTEEYDKFATCRDVIILRTGKLKSINRYYLWSFLHSRYGQELLWRSASQTGQPHITLPTITNMHIPEFSTKLQKKVEELYVNSVEKKRQAEEKYREAEKILLNELGIATWKPKNEQISVRSYNEILRAERFDAEFFQPKYDEIISILSKFDCRPLIRIADIMKSIEPGSAAYQDEGVPFYRVSDISKEGLKDPDIFLDEKKYYTEDLSFKKDMILLSKDGSIGIAYKVEKDMKALSSGALLHLTVKAKDVIPDYLTLVLNSMVVQLQAERDSGGSIIQHWRPEEIEKVIIPVIDISVQKNIAKVVKQSYELSSQSNDLLNQAINAVEVAIDEGEHKALALLK